MSKRLALASVAAVVVATVVLVGYQRARDSGTDDPSRTAPASVPAVAPTTSTTISPLAGVDILERTQPITSHLPRQTAHYTIDYRAIDDAHIILEIELRAILNRADQLPFYEEQLRAYKAEALAWLRSVGADPAAYNIEWRPAEAATL